MKRNHLVDGQILPEVRPIKQDSKYGYPIQLPLAVAKEPGSYA